MTSGSLFTGKTVEEAIAEGLRALGLTQEQAEVEIVSRGSRGLFGIGSEPAQVRIAPRSVTVAKAEAASGVPQAEASQPPAPPTEIPAPAHVPAPAPAPQSADKSPAPPAAVPVTEPRAGATAPPAGTSKDVDTLDEPAGAHVGDETPVDEETLADLAVELLGETVRLMGFDAEIVATWQEPDADNDDRYLLLNLEGEELGALIGRRGETLGNLQYLLRLMVNQRLHQWKNIVVDVEQYRQRRAEHLVQLALRSADQVARTGRPLSLEPMPANERRIIHLALRDHPQVYTESSGEGDRRKIQLLPKRNA
jgi:spoIIIJ-associated protein